MNKQWFNELKKFGYCISALLFAMTPAQGLAQDNYVAAGSAYGLDNDQLLYRELYTAMDENKSVRVDYVSPDGKTFATKTLVYQGEPFQPSVDFRDKRDNEFMSAQFEGARLVLTHGTNNSRNQEIIHDNARIVIDTGYDAYIQLNWSKLMEGKRLRFDLAMPASLASVPMEVRKIKSTESPLYNKEYGKDWVYFRLNSAKKLTSFFSEPVYVAYDPNGKFLMRYHGRSTLDDNRGGPADVRVEYEYLK